jgi:hypothetical protein
MGTLDTSGATMSREVDVGAALSQEVGARAALSQEVDAPGAALRWEVGARDPGTRGAPGAALR